MAFSIESWVWHQMMLPCKYYKHSYNAALITDLPERRERNRGLGAPVKEILQHSPLYVPTIEKRNNNWRNDIICRMPISYPATHTQGDVHSEHAQVFASLARTCKWLFLILLSIMIGPKSRFSPSTCKLTSIPCKCFPNIDWRSIFSLYLISVLPTAFPPSYQEELPRPILLFNQQQFLKDVNLG